MTLPPIDPNAIVVGAWLWGSYGKDLIQWIAKRAGSTTKEKLAGQWDKFNWRRAAQAYRADLIAQYGTMRILSMNEPVELSDIFTDVYVLDKPSAWRRYNIQELMSRSLSEGNIIQNAKRQNGVDVVRSAKRLFIFGKPGAGKTTLLKYITLQSAKGNLDTIPIFVSLKDWADSSLNLMQYIERQFKICSFPDAAKFIEYILSVGKATILFDGLDEVNTEKEQRANMTREIRDFADQYMDSRCVITCRTAAIDYQFERFSYCELADFTFKQVDIFVKKWFDNDKEKSKKFLEDFAQSDNERLHELARTPLLLTLLCINFDETMSFPARRAEIYDEALEALMKKWDASRSIKRDEVYRVLSIGRKRQMLSRIAAETFNEGTIFIKQEDIEARIVKYLHTLPSFNVVDDIDGEIVLKSLEAQHGILVERSQGIYSFSHLTFQEFFAAKHFVNNASDNTLKSLVRNFDNIRWREVLLLTSSLLEVEAADSYLDLFSEEMKKLIISDEDSLNLIRWAEKKSYPYNYQDQVSMQSLYIFMALSHELVVSLASAILLARDENLPFAINKLLDKSLHYSESIAEVRINIESLHYTLVVERERASLIGANCELALVLSKLLSPKIVDILIVSDVQNMKKFLEEQLDSVVSSTRVIVNILNEAYISSTAEFTSQRLLEEFDEDMIMQQSISDILQRTRSLIIEINKKISDIADNIMFYMYHTANRLLSKQGILHGSAKAGGDLIMLAIWTNFEVMGRMSRDYPSNIEDHQIETIKNFLYTLNRSALLPDLEDNNRHRFALSSLNTWDDFTENTRDLMINKYGLGEYEYEKINHEMLKKYLEANILFFECLDIATVSDRGAIKSHLILPPKDPNSFEDLPF